MYVFRKVFLSAVQKRTSGIFAWEENVKQERCQPGKRKNCEHGFYQFACHMYIQISQKLLEDDND